MLEKVLVMIVVTLCGVTLTAQDYCHNLPDKTYATLTARQCDSLIKANASNPNFAIIDVRTPGEYLPKHIEGAINRNSGDSNFSEQLNKLDKNKTWLLHCQSGARSATAFSLMKTLGFREVYNMSGGLNSWNSASLPTVASFASRWAVYDCSYNSNYTLATSETETINIRITNAANDTLKIFSVNYAGNDHFIHPSNAGFSLAGAESNFVTISYSSSEICTDSMTVDFETNLGIKQVKLIRSVVSGTWAEPEPVISFNVFPNPASKTVQISFSYNGPVYYSIFGVAGNLLKSDLLERNNIDISGLDDGLYFIRFQVGTESVTKKLIKSTRSHY